LSLLLAEYTATQKCSAVLLCSADSIYPTVRTSKVLWLHGESPTRITKLNVFTLQTYEVKNNTSIRFAAKGSDSGLVT